MRRYPPHILKIFVANRVREGMTLPEAAAYIRCEYKWSELEFEQMSESERRWWARLDEYLRELEGVSRM